MKIEQIDAVVAWVDGDDPKLAKKRQPFENPKLKRDGHATRFANSWEVYYCIASILKLGTFFRKIFIVTDDQTPDIFEQLEKALPGYDRSKIEIVDHRDLFRNHSDVLPIFNSNAISTMLFDIPGLSDKFVYFNDDVFLLKQTSAEDFFKNGRPVIRGKIRRRAPVRRRGKIRSLTKSLFGKDIFTNTSFKEAQVNGADLANNDPIYCLHDHTPHPILKSQMAEYFRQNPQNLRRNISNRFRSISGFGVLGLLYSLEMKTGNADTLPSNLVYCSPFKNKNQLAYFKRKTKYSRDNDPLFACIQSLDMTPEATQTMFLGWLADKIGIPVFSQNTNKR